MIGRQAARPRRAHIRARVLALATLVLLPLAGSVGTATPVQAADPRVVMGAPFTGKWAYNAHVNPPYNDYNSSHPQVHRAYYGDVSLDYYAAAGTNVKLHAYSPDGTVSFSRNRYHDTCSSVGAGIAGQGIVLNIHVNGAIVGSVDFEHLDGISAGPYTAGMVLGRVTSEPLSSSCYQARHVHLEYLNANQATLACWVDHGNPGVTLGEGTALAVVGAPNASRSACTSVPPPPQANKDPYGNFDVAESPAAGQVRVAGWTIDDDARTSPVGVHVYIGGPAGTAGAEAHDLGAASGGRSDVGAAFPGAGDAHGFDKVLTTGKTGTQQVCAYAINTPAGNNPSLGCKSVSIADPQPFGNADEATGRPGSVFVRGWTVDRSAPTTPTRVHIYIGGSAGQAGAEGHDIGEASGERTDVAAAHPWAGSRHGYQTTVATSKRGSQQICAYAINIGVGENRLIGCLPATISEVSSPPPSTAPTVGPTPPPSGAAPSLSVDPGIISAGQVVTVTYRGSPGAVVEIHSRTQPATAFSRIGTVSLDSNGVGTSTHKPQKSTRMAARVAGGDFSVDQPLIQVRSVASFNAQRAGTRTYTFTGRVYPALNNRLVNIYRNGSLVAQARSDAAGIYKVTRTLGAGTFTFQARTPNDTYNLGATSPPRQVRIY